MRVLIVDNDPLFLGLVSQVIELQGATVTAVESFTDAFAVVAGGEFYDVVLTDVDLGGRSSGVDIAAKIQDDNPDSFVMLMSGRPHDELVRRNPEAARFPLLMKPFRINELTEAIERHRPGLLSLSGASDDAAASGS